MNEVYYPDIIEKPVFYKKEIGDFARMSKIPNNKAIIDQNTGDVFAITSEQYKLIKYEDIVQQIDSVINAHPEYGEPAKSIKTIKDGARLEAKWSFPEIKYPIGAGNKPDLVNPSITVYSSYDTSELLSVLFGAFRLVCSNGLVVGKTFASYKKKHTQNIELDKIDQVLMQGMDAFSEQTKLWSSWMDKNTTSTEYEHVMETMKFNKAEVEEIHEEVETSSGIMLDNMKTKTLTYWIFYNIIAQYVTHKITSDIRKMQLQQQMRKLF